MRLDVILWIVVRSASRGARLTKISPGCAPRRFSAIRKLPVGVLLLPGWCRDREEAETT